MSVFPRTTNHFLSSHEGNWETCMHDVTKWGETGSQYLNCTVLSSSFLFLLQINCDFLFIFVHTIAIETDRMETPLTRQAFQLLG